MADHASKQTTDHDEIQQWADARGGKPAAVKGTGGEDDSGLIRLRFPDQPHSDTDDLKELSWADWFEKFEENKLALVYQEETSDGKTSHFNKLVSR